MNWEYVSFDEAPLDILDGDRSKNYPKQDEFFDQGHCLFLSTANVTKAGFKFQDCQFITEQKDEVLRKGKLKRNDIVITTRGTLGNVAYYNGNIPYEHVRINSGMVIIRADEEKLYAPFLYAYLRSNAFFKQVNQLRSGVAQPQLPIRDMKLIEIPLPKIDEQKRIADSIGQYDWLIENNHRRIQLLEESARLLYKEWFVQLRYPGHEHVKITDGVPHGWKNGAVSDLSNVKGGFAFKAKDWLEEGNPVIKIKNITEAFQIDFSGCSCVDDNIAENASKSELFSGDLLIAMTGATVGKIGLMPRTSKRYYLNQRVGKYFSKVDVNPIPFLFCLSRSHYFHRNVLNLAGGAAQPNISGSQIESIKTLVPELKILEWFNDYVNPIFAQREVLIEQNDKLAQAQDILLPRLMNGELPV